MKLAGYCNFTANAGKYVSLGVCGINTSNVPSQTRSRLVSHFVDLDKERDKVRDKVSSVLPRTSLLRAPVISVVIHRFLFRGERVTQCLPIRGEKRGRDYARLGGGGHWVPR